MLPPESVHLIFELLERADVMHAPVLIERADRLGPNELAAACPHLAERHGPVDLPDRVLYRVAAVVCLCNDAVGSAGVIERRHLATPFDRTDPAGTSYRLSSRRRNWISSWSSAVTITLHPASEPDCDWSLPDWRL
jgi:hypothetical protein